ncbi:tetratricopeptide (TPR) repeat protein [Lewinella aquimaris]|uniref:Tetratricopeptide (TPR) repeat protein n=1 Tax=Neolewinella aquimaris TaxID=1835722 RepID=A0A840E4K3_9BACT|nr:NINE protein [Neolewinella aquimaris]MBB4080111.1 tetratricopeptide (TPR) repeat protein [Neolewinella aquimaris]
MKDKTIAAILAFFGGIIGLQRFYLGQKGMGMAQVFFFVLALSAGPSPFTVMLISLALIFGIIDAISFLSMDPREFDLKYNESLAPTSASGNHRGNRQPYQKQRSMTDRERRFQERQRQRAEQERERERRDRERFNQQPVEQPARAAKSVRRDPGRSDRETGVRHFREYEYEEAIAAFQRALEKNPRDVASHFNIACAYSVEEEADRAFYHLDRAVALGFDDFDRIRTHDSLAYLRIQRAFPDFANNQFRLSTPEPVRISNEEDPLVAAPEQPANNGPVHDELLEQLQRLATLREKGLLTEVEFTTQKRRLLG